MRAAIKDAITGLYRPPILTQTRPILGPWNSLTETWTIFTLIRQGFPQNAFKAVLWETIQNVIQFQNYASGFEKAILHSLTLIFFLNLKFFIQSKILRNTHV